MAPVYRHHHPAVVKRADSYGVGDIVDYRNGSLNTLAQHRIIDRGD
jgi:hypothetical protein